MLKQGKGLETITARELSEKSVKVLHEMFDADITTRGRQKQKAIARQFYFYFMTEYAQSNGLFRESLSSVGASLSDTITWDHATVLHSKRKMMRELDSDKSLLNKFNHFASLVLVDGYTEKQSADMYEKIDRYKAELKAKNGLISNQTNLISENSVEIEKLYNRQDALINENSTLAVRVRKLEISNRELLSENRELRQQYKETSPLNTKYESAAKA